jgi:hypothetical protein
METQQNLGTKGATIQSWSRPQSIRVIVHELQDADPRASESKLTQLLIERCRNDDDALAACCAYAVQNTLHSLASYARRKTPAERSAQKSQIEAAAKQIAEKILVLNLEMPNGKRLRYCTGSYVAKLGGKFVRIGKKAGTKMIGQVFGEKELRDLLG